MGPALLLILVVSFGEEVHGPDDSGDDGDADDESEQAGKPAEHVADSADSGREVEGVGDAVVAGVCHRADHEEQQGDDPGTEETLPVVSEHDCSPLGCMRGVRI